MAFQMVTKVRGYSYESAYWRISDDIYDNGKHLRVVVLMYADKAARGEDKANFFPAPAKSYYIDGKDYLESDSANKTKVELKAWIYEKIPHILEGEEPLLNEDGFIVDAGDNPVLDVGGNPMRDERRSYFHDAINV